MGPTPKFCSPDCRRAADVGRLALRRQGIGPEIPTTCQGCGASLPPRMPGQRGSIRKWCSKNCQQRSVHVSVPKIEGACKQCGAWFETFNSQKVWCSTRCAEVARGSRLPAPLPERMCALAECDVMFVPMYRNQRCCCEAHGKKNWHREAAADGRKKREAWNDRLRDACHRRRALKAGASTGEPVRLAQIAERDRWTCYLCGAKVRKTVKWPDPSSPSLDHVVPLVDGGAHDPSNVRLTHLFCNLAKGRRGGGEQLMLIG
jgi:hypothetical protein